MGFPLGDNKKYKVVDSNGNTVATATTKASANAWIREYHKRYGNFHYKYKVKLNKQTNPSLPKGKFISCKAVKFNRNGSVSIKK